MKCGWCSLCCDWVGRQRWSILRSFLVSFTNGLREPWTYWPDSRTNRASKLPDVSSLLISGIVVLVALVAASGAGVGLVHRFRTCAGAANTALESTRDRIGLLR